MFIHMYDPNCCAKMRTIKHVGNTPTCLQGLLSSVFNIDAAWLGVGWGGVSGQGGSSVKGNSGSSHLGPPNRYRSYLE